MVVPRGLDPDPDRDRIAGSNSRHQQGLHSPDTRLSERERQRLPDDLTAMFSDQAQRLVLPDIDPRRQTTRRIQTPGPLDILLLRGTTNELHDNPSRPRQPDPTNSEANRGCSTGISRSGYGDKVLTHSASEWAHTSEVGCHRFTGVVFAHARLPRVRISGSVRCPG